MLKLIILTVLLLASCSTSRNTNVNIDTKLEVPMLDSSLSDPKVKVFQFLESTATEKPYICLTKSELLKLLYNLESLKVTRNLDKLKVANQVEYCTTIIEELNK